MLHRWRRLWLFLGKTESSILLQRIEREDLSSTLHASVDRAGRLMLSGHDIGPAVARFWPDDEYEYWLTVEPEHVGKVYAGLVTALRDAGVPDAARADVLKALKAAFDAGIFDTDSDFRQWITDQNIPSAFESWT